MHERSANGLDRRTLLRRAAAAGAVGWTAPVVLGTSVSAQDPFTPKCEPGTVTARASFTEAACGLAGIVLRITINFAGPCPCGGPEPIWCAVKTSPDPTVSSSSSSLAFNHFVPINSSRPASGQVALGCTDRDSDTRFAVYDWTITGTDDGGACPAGSISGVTISNRTTVDGSSCPLAVAALATQSSGSFDVGGPRL